MSRDRIAAIPAGVDAFEHLLAIAPVRRLIAPWSWDRWELYQPRCVTPAPTPRCTCGRYRLLWAGRDR